MVDVDTRHTLLAQARGGSRKAVAQLCKHYRDPVQSYIRRLGYPDFEDLTQGFLTHVIEVDFFSTAERERGKFRQYMAGAIKRWIAGEKRRSGVHKRGGDATVEPFEGHDVVSEVTPEDLFTARWRAVILERATQHLLEEFARRPQPEARKRGPLIVPYARESLSAADCERIRLALGYKTNKAVRAAVDRMRERYEFLVESILAETIDTDEAFDAEYEALGLAWSEA